MTSFRESIVDKISKIPEGRIFTIKDLAFDASRSSYVSNILSELVKKNRLKRIEKGAYYRFAMSKLGLGPIPVFQEEKIRYVISKIGGYPSGYYMYNQMGLTEQVPAVITIATPNPVREFKFVNLRINCIKAYKRDAQPDEIEYLRILDAIRQMSHIPGRTDADIYNELIDMYFMKFNDREAQKIAELAGYYPRKVQRITAELLSESGKADTTITRMK